MCGDEGKCIPFHDRDNTCDCYYYGGDLLNACIPFIVDADCKARIVFFHCQTPKWLACHNGTAQGTCFNPKHNEDCTVVIEYSNTPTQGYIECSSCNNTENPIDDCVFWKGRDEHNFLTVKVNTDSISAVNDDSCIIPHFKYEGLLWDWCVRGDGSGELTNNRLNAPKRCTVKMSSVCLTGDTSCGVIDCSDESCKASWNMPDKLKYYESPVGCMGGSSPIAPNENYFIVRVSVAGSVVVVAIAATIVTVAACFCYDRYKRPATPAQFN